MSDSKRDYYEVLGIGKGSSDADIKKAFRKLAKQYHPDVNPGDRAAETRFKEINEAYEVLSDPQKKSMYDQYGHAGVDPNGFGAAGFGDFGFGDLGDIFGTIFGGSGFGRSSRNRSGPRKGADLRYELEITFEEAAFGLEKVISVRRNESCDKCEGTGAKAGTSPETCKHCGGSGQVQYKQSTPFFGHFVNVKTCEICQGEGKVIFNPCSECGGKGKIRSTVKIPLNIPGGIDDGQTISLRGEGDPGSRGGPPGDLYVTVKVKPHVLFKRRGNDVVFEMPITFVQAALGAELEVPTLDGKVKYSIPEGTQTGSIFRLKGKGIPYLRGSGRGDQFVKVEIDVPKKLNEQQKAVLREFAEISSDEVHDNRRGFFEKMKDALGM